MPKSPSALGSAIEAAVAVRYSRHRDNVQYLLCFRTRKGSVFALERVTVGHINIWLPDQEAAKREAERSGLSVERKAPWPEGRASKYGRISALRPIPELSDEPLLKVQATNVGDAMRVLGALA